MPLGAARQASASLSDVSLSGTVTEFSWKRFRGRGECPPTRRFEERWSRTTESSRSIRFLEYLPPTIELLWEIHKFCTVIYDDPGSPFASICRNKPVATMEDTVVKLSVPLSDEVIHLSTLDQQAQRHYVKALLFFKLDHTGSDDPIIQHLKWSLEVALSEIPDFAATVAPVPGSRRKELELRLNADSGVPWRVVDYTTNEGKQLWSYGSYDELAANYFPLSGVPAAELLAHPACTSVPEDARALAGLLVQLSLVDGGLVMAICWHHTVSDARSMNVFVNSWARHTKTLVLNGLPDSPATLPEETRERWRLDYHLGCLTIDQLSDYIVNPDVRSSSFVSSPHLLDRLDPVTAPFEISTWYISASSLQALREALGGPAMLFTPVEAVSALIWKHVSQARQLRDKSENGTSLFTTRLDFRARLKPPLHGDFIGNVCEPNARARVPLVDVCSASTGSSLAALATAIRTATEAVDDAVVRHYIGLINTLSAVTDLTWNYDAFPGLDLGVTDLSGLDTLRTDWGPELGTPSCMRLAFRENGLVYFFPVDKNGGFEVQVQSEADALERLKADEKFTRFASFRC